MLFASVALVWVSLACYRILLLGLPFFTDSVASHPWLNIGCGVASDLTLGLAVTALGLVATAAQRPRPRRWLARAATAGAVLFAYSLAVHLRYVEHFGMGLRPFHVGALATPEVWLVGTFMVFRSLRTDLYLALVALAMAVLWRGGWLVRREAAWRVLAGRARGALIGLCAVLWVAANSAMINMQTKPGMHPELRYNAYTALVFNLRRQWRDAALPMPSSDDLLSLRGLLGGDRVYAEGALAASFPLWQQRISTAATGVGAAERDGLRRYIEAERRRLGPWNVVMLVAESLRAHELQALGNDEPAFAGLTPNLSALAAGGVTFTEVISAGLATHFGQTASQCSVYGAQGFTILQQAPTSNAVCLSDVFERHGYQTNFFYGADNHFDNQDIFYKFHRMLRVHGQEDMPTDSAKGGWGYSDHALFNYTLDQLAAAHGPVFATVLSLTNHEPMILPADAPSTIAAVPEELRLQVLRYVDWSIGELYRGLTARLPHTIFVVVADHGRFWGETLSDGHTAFNFVRTAARIPLLIAIPGMPAELRGARIDTLASNVDVPPTILSLLGWLDEPNQFMGEDAFTRRGRVYIDWQNDLLALSTAGGSGHVEYLSDRIKLLLASAGRYNELAPPDLRRRGD